MKAVQIARQTGRLAVRSPSAAVVPQQAIVRRRLGSNLARLASTASPSLVLRRGVLSNPLRLVCYMLSPRDSAQVLMHRLRNIFRRAQQRQQPRYRPSGRAARAGQPGAGRWGCAWCQGAVQAELRSGGYTYGVVQLRRRSSTVIAAACIIRMTMKVSVANANEQVCEYHLSQ